MDKASEILSLSKRRQALGLNEVRLRILMDLSVHGASPIAAVASRMEVSRHTLRRHFSALRGEGWLERESTHENPVRIHFALSPIGRKNLQSLLNPK